MPAAPSLRARSVAGGRSGRTKEEGTGNMSEYEDHARHARRLLYSEKSEDRDVVLAACRAARDAAPDDVEARHWGKVIDSFRPGHRFKHSTYPATIAVDAEDAELIADVESAFRRDL